jgi:dienelactone hydrolase
MHAVAGSPDPVSRLDPVGDRVTGHPEVGHHDVAREDVAFTSEGTTLRGWLFMPQSAEPLPAVVMSSGFAGVKEGFLGDPYHQVLARAGIAVLLYDHANTGESDGEPRQELDPVRQQRGYRDAITFLAAHPGIDADRIGIWGTSYSGGHVLAVAAHDRRVRAVVSQAMTISGHDNLRRRHSPAAYAELRRGWADERLRLARGEAPTVVAAFGEDSESNRYQAARPSGNGATGATRSRCGPGSSTTSTNLRPSSIGSRRLPCS